MELVCGRFKDYKYLGQKTIPVFNTVSICKENKKIKISINKTGNVLHYDIYYACLLINQYNYKRNKEVEMRKLLIRFVIISLILLSVTMENHASKKNYTEIRFTIGQDVIQINQDKINVEKTYIYKGTTMVPLRVITEAFGAEIEWDWKENSITVMHLGKNIKLFNGKSIAQVNGLEKSLVCPAKIIKGTTMVPLRFISENFGARVGYHSKTKQVRVVIPYFDYDNRFRYISKAKIGDSYYGWSVAFPKGCTVVDKQSSGKSVLVTNEEGGYYYYIYNVRTNRIQNESDLLQELLGYVDNERIVSQKIIDKDGLKWADVVLESQDEIYQYRAVLKGQRLYQIHFYTYNKIDFFNQEKGARYEEIIDSFEINYAGNDPDIRDINEIEGDLYTYRDKAYGWTIDLIPTMNMEVKRNFNYYEIMDERGEDRGITCSIEFYSIDESDSLNQYADVKIQEIKEDINQDYLSGPSIAGIKTDSGIPAKLAKFKANLGNKELSFYDLYLISGKHKYAVSLYGKTELFESGNAELYEKILCSFTPIESDRTIRAEDTYTKLRGQVNSYQNSEYNWSCEYPAWWYLNGNENSDATVISDRSGLLEVYVGAARNVSKDSVKREIMEKIKELENSEDFKIISQTEVLKEGIPMWQVQCEYVEEGIKYYYTAYVFQVEDRTFGVHFTVADIVNSEANIRRLDELWQSMKFGQEESFSGL